MTRTKSARTRAEPGSEMKLHHLWSSVLSDHAPVRTRNGESLKVLSPGRPASGPGPDFTGCIIDVDGEIWTGDAELHVHEDDWRRHGHSGEEAFEDLLLHVCFRPSRSAEAPEEIRRTVVLDQQLAQEHLRRFREEERERGNEIDSRTRCSAGRVIGGDAQRIQEGMEYLERYGRRRFRRRTEEIRDRMSEASHRREVLSGTLLECMGMHRNREAARSLAGRVSFGTLKRFLRGPGASEEVQRNGEAWLLTKAGLLTNTAGLWLFDGDSAWRVYRERAMTLTEDVEPVLERGTWDRAGTSPMNSPFRRIAGFVGLFRRWCLRRSVYQTEEHLIRHVMEEARNDRATLTSGLRSVLDSITIAVDEAASYWTDHCAPGDRLKTPAGLVGRHRAAVVWINGVAPYLAALGRMHDLPELEQAINRLGETCPLPVGDHRTRRAGQFLFGAYRDDVPLTLFIEQGLHALYSGNCRFGPPGCSRCELRSDLGDC